MQVGHVANKTIIKWVFYLIVKWLKIVKFTIALRNKRANGKYDWLHEARPVNIKLCDVHVETRKKDVKCKLVLYKIA